MKHIFTLVLTILLILSLTSCQENSSADTATTESPASVSDSTTAAATDEVDLPTEKTYTGVPFYFDGAVVSMDLIFSEGKLLVRGENTIVEDETLTTREITTITVDSFQRDGNTVSLSVNGTVPMTTVLILEGAGAEAYKTNQLQYIEEAYNDGDISEEEYLLYQNLYNGNPVDVSAQMEGYTASYRFLLDDSDGTCLVLSWFESDGTNSYTQEYEYDGKTPIKSTYTHVGENDMIVYNHVTEFYEDGITVKSVTRLDAEGNIESVEYYDRNGNPIEETAF